jgi:rSAM/selenodomain-associated transferase 1
MKVAATSGRPPAFPDARILVFAKAPVPGRVKTRLSAAVGRRGAARIYRRMLWDALNRLTAARLCPVELWCSPSTDHAFFHACRRRFGVVLRVQQGTDLGARMHYALRHSLTHGARRALVVGGDCPDLTADDCRRALAMLGEHRDAVLGPATDGGYVLIGSRRPAARLFAGIEWGGSRVCALTRRRLAGMGWSWGELPPRADVDRPRDLKGRRLAPYRR